MTKSPHWRQTRKATWTNLFLISSFYWENNKNNIFTVVHKIPESANYRFAYPALKSIPLRRETLMLKIVNVVSVFSVLHNGVFNAYILSPRSYTLIEI